MKLALEQSRSKLINEILAAPVRRKIWLGEGEAPEGYIPSSKVKLLDGTPLNVAIRDNIARDNSGNKLIYGPPKPARLKSCFFAENLLEAAICEHLAHAGIAYRRQVSCANGIIDILTKFSVYELKPTLYRSDLFRAIGQSLSYSACFSPRRQPCVISQNINDDLKRIANSCGVKLLCWPIDKGQIL
jgi:hypothetical protein